MITKFTIYGERCSGTNYLEDLMNINFDINITWEFGWKHFFGFNNLINNNDTLFICIVKDLVPWLNSFYRNMHHLPLKYDNIPKNIKIKKFLNDEIFSFNDNNRNRDISKEIMQDRNIYTNERYKNIYELRHTKLKYMIDDLPNHVNNYILIKYEDLINNFDETMFKLYNKGLKIKTNIKFPLNTTNYKGYKNKKFIENNNYNISNKLALTNPNLNKTYEIKLKYIRD